MSEGLFELLVSGKEHPARVPDGDADGLHPEVGNVEGLEVEVVEPACFLRKNERLGDIAVLVDMAEIGLAVLAVAPLAGEDEPAAVRGPAVVCIGLVSLDLVQWPDF